MTTLPLPPYGHADSNPVGPKNRSRREAPLATRDTAYAQYLASGRGLAGWEPEDTVYARYPASGRGLPLAAQDTVHAQYLASGRGLAGWEPEDTVYAQYLASGRGLAGWEPDDTVYAQYRLATRGVPLDAQDTVHAQYLASGRGLPAREGRRVLTGGGLSSVRSTQKSTKTTRQNLALWNRAWQRRPSLDLAFQTANGAAERP